MHRMRSPLRRGQQRLALRDVDGDGAVRQLDPLGPAGGAAGVLQQRQRLAGRWQRQGRNGGESGVEAANAFTDHDHMGHAGRARDRFGHRRQVRIHHQHQRRRVFQDRCQFVGGVKGIERNLLRPGRQCCPVRQRRLRSNCPTASPRARRMRPALAVRARRRPRTPGSPHSPAADCRRPAPRPEGASRAAAASICTMVGSARGSVKVAAFTRAP